MRIEYKGYLIAPDKNFPQMLTVQVVGRGGKIPDVLQSLFTSGTEAKQSVDRYLDGKK